MQTLEHQLTELQETLTEHHENPISQDDFDRWKNNQVTKMLFLELSERYLENLIEEPVVMAHAQRISENDTMHHTNPVEETAINSALKSGRNQVLSTLLEYEPVNLNREYGIDD